MKIFIFISILIPHYCLANTVYVKANLLRIYQNPSRSSAIVGVAPKGQSVNYLKKNKGMYVQIRHKDLTGWVIKYSLSKKPLSQKRKVSIFQNQKDISDKAQKKASVFASGGVVSGATNVMAMVFGEYEVKLNIPADEKKRELQYKSLENIMNNQVGMSEAKDFIP